MIYRETHQANYTVVSNSLINTKLPSDAKNVLTWLLSKPKNWKLIKVVIAEALGLSKHRVQQAITTLRNLGYLFFFRHKDGSGHWDVYESPRPQYQPQTRVVKPSPSMPTKAFSTDITNTDYQKILKTTTDEPLPDPVEPITPIVVVSNLIEQAAPDPLIIEELKRLPLEPKETRIAARTLSNFTLDECKAVLSVYAAALVKGGISNRIGYLIGLTKAAKNGTLTVTTANQPITLEERIAKERQRKAEAEARGRVSNEQWAELMRKQYGLTIPV